MLYVKNSATVSIQRNNVANLNLILHGDIFEGCQICLYQICYLWFMSSILWTSKFWEYFIIHELLWISSWWNNSLEILILVTSYKVSNIFIFQNIYLHFPSWLQMILVILVPLFTNDVYSWTYEKTLLIVTCRKTITKRLLATSKLHHLKVLISENTTYPICFWT